MTWNLYGWTWTYAYFILNYPSSCWVRRKARRVSWFAFSWYQTGIPWFPEVKITATTLQRAQTHPATWTTALHTNCSSYNYQQGAGAEDEEKKKENERWKVRLLVVTNSYCHSPCCCFSDSRTIIWWLQPFWVPRGWNYNVVSYSSLSCTRASSLYCSRGGAREQSTARMALRILRSRTCRSQAG